METSYSDVRDCLEDRRSVLGPLHTQIAIDEMFIRGSAILGDSSLMQYLKGFPPGFIARIPSIGADAVQRLRNQICGEPPDVRVLRRGNRRGEGRSEREREDQRALQEAIKAELAHLSSATTENPFITLADHAFGLGLAILYYPFDPANMPKHPFKLRTGTIRKPRDAKEERKLIEYERKRREARPFRFVPIHPVTAFWDAYCDPIEDIIFEEEFPLGTFAKKFPHLEIQSRSYGATAKLVTYWSATEYGYWLDGRPLLTKKDGANEDGIAPNRTGVLPVRMARAGFGFTTSKREPEYAIQGLIRGARPAILSLITDYNVQEVMKLLYVWPSEEFEVTGEQGQADLDAYARGPGSLWAHGTTVKRVSNDAQHGPPQWAFQIQNYNTGLAEAHMGSRVLSGMDEDETAGGLRTRVGLARQPVRVTQQALEGMFSNAMMDILYIQKHHMVQALVIPTANGWEEFDSKRIPDDARLAIDLTPNTPEDIAFQLDDLLKRKQQGAASTRRILELDPNVADVDDELAEIDSDTLMASGDLMKMAQEQAMNDYMQRTQRGLAEPNQIETQAPNYGQLPGENDQVTPVTSPLSLERQIQPPPLVQ